MMGVLTSDLFIQLTTTLAHLSNMTLNTANLGGVVSNETLEGQWPIVTMQWTTLSFDHF